MSYIIALLAACGLFYLCAYIFMMPFYVSLLGTIVVAIVAMTRAK